MSSLALECPHWSACPGCPRFGQLEPSPPVRQRLEALCQRFGAPPPHFEQGEPLRFRYRSRLAVRGRRGRAKIGIFEAGSHRVVDIPRCPIHHPHINAIVSVIKAGIRELDVSPYSEGAQRGLLRYLQLVVQPADGRVQLTLVCNSEESASIRPLVEYLLECSGSSLHSVWFNAQLEPGNRILGPTWELLQGDAWLLDEVEGTTLFYHPGAFGQSHWQLARGLGAAARSWLAPTRLVAEYYAGVGAIGLGLLSFRRELRFNEASPHAVVGLRRALDQLPQGSSRQAAVWQGPADEALEMLDGADGVLVDPPRKGLDDGLIAALVAARSPKRLSYVSCGLASLERDLARLLAAGWSLRQLSGWDLFAYTEHIESLALLERA